MAAKPQTPELDREGHPMTSPLRLHATRRRKSEIINGSTDDWFWTMTSSVSHCTESTLQVHWRHTERAGAFWWKKAPSERERERGGSSSSSSSSSHARCEYRDDDIVRRKDSHWLRFFFIPGVYKSSPRRDDLDWVNLPQYKRTTQRYRYIIKMPNYCSHLYL